MSPSQKIEYQNIVSFYDDRYATGYMEEWPEDKKQRIYEVVRSLGFPEKGDALDFGCGNGVFTHVIKRALPGWNIDGMDISSVAIEQAQKRCSDCSFFLPENKDLKVKKYDFLFTHHVLEHVDDLEGIWQAMSQYAKGTSSMLHVLPCGNPGSFEHQICLLHRDGIDKNKGDKFFFEDVSHVRRLNTEKMNRLAVQYGFSLSGEWYSHQLWGGIDWITLERPSLILSLSNPKRARNALSAFKLVLLGIALAGIKVMRFPSNTIDYKKDNMSLQKYYLCFLLLFLLYPFSKLMNLFLRWMAEREWSHEKGKRSGSEMYLYYTKTK